MNHTDRFDLKYKNRPDTFGTEPFDLVKQLPQLISGKTVLDLGAGNGRNTLYLLNLGYQVTAVDSSDEGLRVLRDRAGKNNKNLQLVQSDVTQFTTDKTYDAVLAIGLLHFLPINEAEKLVKNMQDWTKPNGVNIVAVKMTQNRKGDLPHVFKPNELKNMYGLPNWKIELYDEFSLPQKPIAQIIARKLKN